MCIRDSLLPFETYQVQQLDRRSYRMLLAGGGGRRPELTPARERAMHAALAEVLGHDVRLSIDPVEDIATAGLKARTVVNLSD